MEDRISGQVNLQILRDFPTGIFYCGVIMSCIHGHTGTQFLQNPYIKNLVLDYTYIPTHSASKIIHSMKVNIDKDIFADKKYIYKILLHKNILMTSNI